MNYWHRHKNFFLVVLIAAVFFIGTSSFNYLTQEPGYVKWSSPDETANYFFARQYAQTGQLAFFDRAGVVGDFLLMPRSVRNDFGWLKPVSFLGIILIYGSLGAALGVGIIPYLTPFFAAIGLVIFYLLVRKLFSERVGLWSAAILASFPVYIYYTVRSMFHNVLFLVLLLIGIYLAVLALGRKEENRRRFLEFRLPVWYWFELGASLAAGIFFGLALITRTSEILWLGPALFFTWIFYARRFGVAKTLLLLSGAVLPLLAVAYNNQILYNSFWYGGYNEMNRSLDDIAASGRQLLDAGSLAAWPAYLRLYWDRIIANVFYFGFNFQQSLRMAFYYILDMFPWLSYAAAFGFLLLIGQNALHPKKKQIILAIAWLAADVFLVCYYGSWQFNDNPDLSRHTIGNSYTRYWLPIYLGLIPLASSALVRFTQALFCAGADSAGRIRRYLVWGLQAGAVATLAAWSLNFVLFGSEEGLAHLYYINRAEKVNTERIWSATEPDSIIITRYYDKFFWPERRVIMGTFPNDEIFAAAAKLAEYYPVYYYNFYFSDADIQYLNDRRLSVYGLKIEPQGRFNSDFGLYKIEKYAPAESSAQ